MPGRCENPGSIAKRVRRRPTSSARRWVTNQGGLGKREKRPFVRQRGKGSKGALDHGSLRLVELECIVHHPPAALDVVVGVAWEGAPRRLRQEKSITHPAVYTDGAVSKVGDSRFEIRPEFRQRGWMHVRDRTKAAPQRAIRKTDGLGGVSPGSAVCRRAPQKNSSVKPWLWGSCRPRGFSPRQNLQGCRRSARIQW